MHRIPGRILLITAAFALFLVPIAAIAAGDFEDVSDDNVFKADIEWLANAGVTKGCNPPTNTKFCPSDNVTREQMAAFMHRLAINKVVDAKTAVNADNAADADKVDGKDSTAFVQKGEVNSIGSSMMTDSVGVAQATGTADTEITAGPQTILSVAIETPAAGYVLVQSTYNPSSFHVAGTLDYCVFDVSAVDGERPAGPSPGTYVPEDAAPGFHAFLSASSRVFPVDGAGSHTFYLVGERISGECGVNDIVLTALYVPVGNATLTGTIAGSAEAPSGSP